VIVVDERSAKFQSGRFRRSGHVSEIRLVRREQLRCSVGKRKGSLLDLGSLFPLLEPAPPPRIEVQRALPGKESGSPGCVRPGRVHRDDPRVPIRGSTPPLKRLERSGRIEEPRRSHRQPYPSREVGSRCVSGRSATSSIRARASANQQRPQPNDERDSKMSRHHRSMIQGPRGGF
jgi:hypothetical protein